MSENTSEWCEKPCGDGYYQCGNRIIEVFGDTYADFGRAGYFLLSNLKGQRLKKIILDIPEYEKDGVIWNMFPEGEGAYWCKDNTTGKVNACDIIAHPNIWEIKLYVNHEILYCYMSPKLRFTKRTEK